MILEAGDFIRQVHSDSSRIVAVSNKGTLFNVYVENSVVKYTTLKLPSSRGKSLSILLKPTDFKRSGPSSIINILVSIVPGRRKAVHVPFDWWILYCLRQWNHLRLGS